MHHARRNMRAGRCATHNTERSSCNVADETQSIAETNKQTLLCDAMRYVATSCNVATGFNTPRAEYTHSSAHSSGGSAASQLSTAAQHTRRSRGEQRRQACNRKPTWLDLATHGDPKHVQCNVQQTRIVSEAHAVHDGPTWVRPARPCFDGG